MSGREILEHKTATTSDSSHLITAIKTTSKTDLHKKDMTLKEQITKSGEGIAWYWGLLGAVILFLAGYIIWRKMM